MKEITQERKCLPYKAPLFFYTKELYTGSTTFVLISKNIKPAEYSYKNKLVPVIDIETEMYGYMNPKLKIIIPCEFSYAKSFVGKYAVVKYNGKDAGIDKKGNIFYSEDLK